VGLVIFFSEAQFFLKADHPRLHEPLLGQYVPGKGGGTGEVAAVTPEGLASLPSLAGQIVHSYATHGFQMNFAGAEFCLQTVSS
jgi:hypothetical protein